MRSYYLFLLFLSVFSIYPVSASAQKDSSLVFFPESRLYPVVFLDPLECQIMGGSYFLFQGNGDNSLFSTVNLGFSMPVFGGSGRNIFWEFNFGTAIFSQFDLIRKEDGTFLAGLINNDFKLSGDISVREGNNLLRLRTLHISSHLGDDYLQRHGDSLTNDKTVNYEQADLTYLKMYGNNYWYAGAGYIYTIHVFRERFSLQTGGLINFRESKRIGYFAGLDIKFLEENKFNPDIRAAFGFNLKRKNEPLIRIWAEYYSGCVPYSTIEYGSINWLGAAMAIALK